MSTINPIRVRFKKDHINFVGEDLTGVVLAFDTGNPASYSGSGITWFDLSGNGYDAIKTGSRVSFNSSENAWEFTGTTDVVSEGIYITGLNYVSGSSDTISNLSIVSWIKNNSGTTSHGNDQRIILSFDRSAVFRFGIGNDSISNVEGKPVFGFCDATDNPVDIGATSYSGDLRDDKWHQVCVTFDNSNIKFYVDGILVHTSTGSYGSIGSHSDTETPRYGWIGNGSEATSAGGTTAPDDLFYGFISKINYYYRTLNDSEVLQNYNALRGRFGL